MATKKTKEDGFVVWAPDGNVYFIPQDPLKAPKPMPPECEGPLKQLRACLKATGFKSDKVVLSGVMTRSDGKPLSRKRMAQRSAKRRP